MATEEAPKRYYPHFPEAADIALFIDNLIEVTGSASAGILFKYGEKLGEKYSKLVECLEMFDSETKIKRVLGSFAAYDWFDDIDVKFGDETIEIMLSNSFELGEKTDKCNMLRGLFSGLVSSIYQAKWHCKEEHNLRKEGRCRFTLEEVKD